MIGAIIGDLAAWTWEHAHDVFYPQLLSDKAVLSEFGLSVLATADALDSNAIINNEDYRDYILPWFRITNDDVVCLSAEAHNWFIKQEYDYKSLAQGVAVVRTIPCAWYQSGDIVNCSLFFEHTIEKEEWYAMQFLRKMIYLLRNGHTKDEVYAELGNIFKGCRHDWDWKNQETMIPYVLRAWDAFYKAYDFGSALHNAMRMQGNKRLLGTLTGAIAEAMYGCRSYFIKKKYAKEGEFAKEIILPDKTSAQYQDTISKIHKQKERVRVFFPKNDAATNVELHKWVPVQHKGKHISPEIRRRIIKAFHPSWDYRYGFYLDNGWIYNYRSGFIHSRFQLAEDSNGNFSIVNVQSCDNYQSWRLALEETMYPIEYRWDWVSGET